MSSADPAGGHARFDARTYWRERLGAHPDLRGTGTAGLPVAWQRWMYRGKQRACLALLGRAGVRLEGARVLDFGCGTGWFEDLWERHGAVTAGIDLVPEAVEALAAAHPDRRYACADLAGPCDLSGLGTFELVTAIDVLFHVVDEESLAAIVARLAALLVPGGHVLFTDALRDHGPAPHVRFRDLARWRGLLGATGLEIVARQPTFVAANRVVRGAARLPWLVGAAQHHLDSILLRVVPALSHHWALLARRYA